MKAKPNAPCPCGRGVKYKRCCGPLHRGVPAPTPLALMRSRYSAYALGLVDYIVGTTHPEGPMFEEDGDAWKRSIASFARSTRFAGLEIVATTEPDADGDARVHFVAQLEQGGAAVPLDEDSVFRKHDGRWKYFAPAEVVQG